VRRALCAACCLERNFIVEIAALAEAGEDSFRCIGWRLASAAASAVEHRQLAAILQKYDFGCVSLSSVSIGPFAGLQGFASVLKGSRPKRRLAPAR
jgi:hypothetical protein